MAYFLQPNLEQFILFVQRQQEKIIKQSDDSFQDQDETQRSVPLPLKLSPFFNNDSLSDITLMIGSSIFHAHRLILSSWSPVFKEMLLERSKSDEPHVLEEAQEYEAIFSDFLKFMYTETIDISKDTVYSFHKLSKEYGVKEICDLCEEFLIGEVSNNIIALQTLTDAEEFGVTKVYDHCFKFLGTNFFRLSNSSLKKMSPSLFLKLLESSDLVVISEAHLCNQALDWLYTDGDKGKDEYQEYTEAVISKIHFAQMSFSELSTLKSKLPTHPKMDDRSKQCLQDSLHDAIEWKALVSCKGEELNLVPHHIRTNLSKKHCVEPRFYVPDPFYGYQTLTFSENLQSKLNVSVTGVSAYSTFSEESSTWSVTEAKLCCEKSKKWTIHYRFKPQEIHVNCAYRLVILTKYGKALMKSVVTTSKGVVTKTEVRVEQVLHDTKALQKLKSVKIKVVILVKMSDSDRLRGQLHLQMLRESEEELRQTNFFLSRRKHWRMFDLSHMDSDFYDE